ncbi:MULTISPECIES: cytochrome c oxidase subunit II [unclassified Chelatococcus]|uniref:cytochrome c oxidase subunit II n=1 Tax=unclassified Chelatococcus TaxID=2638111 RepID=UPI001BCD885D|nr:MULTISPECIES: cytochrome c oxidase subunit II [unclassified Chelatococcus]MBS7695762.1 cytochrome c oxidase subunit II [Chelatococcus sp. YT9]MBX3555863.1 cytochrome c oxidase subunit II [Chelatococcus sp.]
MDSFRLRFLAALVAAAALVVQSGAAFAGVGQPSPWQMGLQVPVTGVAEFMHWFHDGLLWIISIIVVFVLALIIYVVFRFNEKRNPVPSKTTHNALLEVAWTIVPVLILVVIAVPSFRLLRLQLVTPPADITIKATGHQWYWSYEYPEDQNGGFSFDSNMDANGQPRLLAVDNEVVLPVGKTVRVQVTAADVIHAFAMPSFGLKIDAIPGRLNETWFKAEKEGIFYGQCSLICGQNHAFMPIAIRIVSEQQYAAWLTEAKQKFASTSKAPLAVASRTEVLSAE